MRHTYRSRSQALTGAGILATVGLVGLQEASSSFVDALDDGPASVIGWGLFLAVGLAFWWCGLRLVFSRVELSPSEVVVRNVFRTWRVPWDEVDGFSGDHGIVLMHLQDGQQIALTALSGPNVLFRPKHRWVPEMADRLNADAARLARASGQRGS